MNMRYLGVDQHAAAGIGQRDRAGLIGADSVADHGGI